MALMSDRSWESWVDEYSKAHQHPINRMCHTFGIPAVAGSVVLFGGALFFPPLLIPAIALFVGGWAVQFVGHAYEGKPPEFLKDGRFLFVGLRWWAAKMTGRA